MIHDLVVINRKKEAVASHLIISEGMSVTHHSTLELIKKYKNELSGFGRVSFQMRPLETNGGIQNRKEYMLNEHQAMFLITLMRNNKRTVAFKQRLVRQFINMKSFIHDRLQSSVEFKAMAEMLYQYRDVNGKETQPYHYSNEARLVNGVLTGIFSGLERNRLSPDEIALLNRIQARNAVLIGSGMPYRQRKEALLVFAELQELSSSHDANQQLLESR